MNDTHQQTSLVHFGGYAAIGLHESRYPFLLLERNESGGWHERTPAQWAEALDLVEVCGAGDADRADAVLRELARMDEPQRSSTIDRLLLAGLAPILPSPTDETRRTIHSELTAAARKLMLTELDSWRAD